MASDYNTTGVHVEHCLYILRSVINDLAETYGTDMHGRRFIIAEREELAEAAGKLKLIIAHINNADTCQTVEAVT
jgi:hypothetical protein